MRADVSPRAGAPGRLASRTRRKAPRWPRAAARIDPTRGNLPAEVNGFLGRAVELEEIAALLEGSRLVTLTGPPGIGKSRLGVEVGYRTGTAQDGGAWLVELAAVDNERGVPEAVAAALSIAEQPGQSVSDAIVARLRSRRALVVLDNCEHLVGACAQLADALLRGCPGIRIVATSREPLGVAGERLWQVAPLDVPPVSEPPDPAALERYSAVALFLERGRAVKPEFLLNADAAPAVAEICRRLDGIPLAIELAAARVDVLTAPEIVRRLDDRFALLTGGARSDLPRHRTLAAALDWSHDLLSAPERALLARLSVFCAGFSLEAAEAVCAGGEVEAERVLDLLARLVATSLVVSNTENSRGRYRLLETIRAYGSEQLERSGDRIAVERAHARCFVALAEAAEPGLAGPDEPRWIDRLEGERENLRAAISWSIAHDRADWALRLSGALLVYWRVRGHFSEGRDLLAAALDARDGAEPAFVAKALWALGFLELMVGGVPAAARAARESLELSRAQGDRRGEARALLVLGNAGKFMSAPDWRTLLDQSAAAAHEAGDRWCESLALYVAGFAYAAWDDLPAARPLLERCLAISRGAGHRHTLTCALLGLGKVAMRQGDLAEAEALLLEGVDGAVALGDEYTRAVMLEHLAELELRRGGYERARGLLEEVVGVFPELTPDTMLYGPFALLGAVAHAEGDPAGAREHFERAIACADAGIRISRAVQGLGEVALAGGDGREARRHFEDALARARAGVPDELSVADALHGLGELARDAGDGKRAAALHHEALQLRRKIGDSTGIVASLEAIGGLAATGGRPQRGALLIGAARGQRERRGYACAPWWRRRRDADLDAVGAELSGAALGAALKAGAALTLEEAATEASKGRGRRGRPGSGWSSLTEIEQRVATLVAEGLTNREIAERLFVSMATVKSHVSRIFPKLDVTSRRELAREVWRREGGPDRG